MLENKYDTYIKINLHKGAPKSGEQYAMIRGDRIAILCDYADPWERLSGSFQARHCTVQGRALAIVLARYANK